MPDRGKNIFMFVALILLASFIGSCTRTTTEAKRMGKGGDSTAVADSVTAGRNATPTMSLSYEQQQGKVLYLKYCSVCHGAEGKGDGFNAFNLDPRPRDFTDRQFQGSLTDTRLLQTIQLGGRGVNKSSLMPSWGDRLTGWEAECVASYVRLFGEAH